MLTGNSTEASGVPFGTLTSGTALMETTVIATATGFTLAFVAALFFLGRDVGAGFGAGAGCADCAGAAAASGCAGAAGLVSSVKVAVAVPFPTGTVTADSLGSSVAGDALIGNSSVAGSAFGAVASGFGAVDAAFVAGFLTGGSGACS